MTTKLPVPLSMKQTWAAVGSMSMCVTLLIASEFMPVSLLTPMAAELHASEGMVGQAISVSGIFAVVTSLLIATIASRLDRRHVLIGLSFIMLASLVLVAIAPNLLMLMCARALLGITVGGFWALATATIMRLVPTELLPKALGTLYTGNAIATTFAAPIGSYLGGLIGWRGVFWALTPLVIINLVWQWISLPSMPSDSRSRPANVLALLKRRHIALAMVAIMLAFAGAFSTFTYLRPFLETRIGADISELSLLLLGLGMAGFVGTHCAGLLAGRYLNRLLAGLPLALAVATLALLGAGHSLWLTALGLMARGALNSAIPVAWATWLTRGIQDQPESGGGLMVAAIQLSIMVGAAFGGLLLDRLSLTATWISGAVMLLLASLAVGNGRRLLSSGAPPRPITTVNLNFP